MLVKPRQSPEFVVAFVREIEAHAVLIHAGFPE